ncbi:MAG: phosphatase PAP2 family protein [Patescibacteria group bacterium]
MLLLNLDQLIFEKIYQVIPHNLFFDWFFLLLTTIAHPKIIWFPLIILFLIFYKQHKGWMFFESAIAIGIGVVINEYMVKNIFARLRPFEFYDWVTTIDHTAEGFSFPSSHALVAFSFTMVIILNTKSKLLHKLLIVLAVLICLSRIYLGVHFPGDVITGGIIGALLGWLSSTYLPRFYKALFHKQI